MNNKQRFGIVFEKNAEGRYVYKKVSEVLSADENVVEVDKSRYDDFKNGKLSSLKAHKLNTDIDILTLTITEEVYDKLMEKCLSNSDNYEECVMAIKELLKTIGENINSISVMSYGTVSALTFEWVEKKDVTKDKKKEVNGKTAKTEKEEKDLPEITEIDMSKVDPDQVIANIKKKVIAQDATVETIVNNIYNNQLIIETGDEDLINSSKSSILMDGPTGTGKTLIVKEVSKALSLPMIIRSSTIYSAAGYKGEDLSEMLTGLLKKTGGNLELAERGIIVLDEFDKLGGKSDSELEMRKAVQQELLTFFSGGKFPVEYEGKTIEFDTSKLTFICLGAFTDLRERKIKEELSEDGYYTIEPEDYINEGILREMVGRFSLITCTRDLSKDNLVEMLKKSEISPLVQLGIMTKKAYNKELVYDDALVEKVAEVAYAANTGARALQTVTNGIRDLILTELRKSKSDKIEITVDMIERSQSNRKRKVA